jgi:hypothetical protein
MATLKYSAANLWQPKIYNPPDFTAKLAILCSLFESRVTLIV